MAKWIVARTIRRGTSYIVAGTVLDDALVDVQSLIAAGEQLVDATVSTYASASDRALAARARGASFEECDSIMLAAASIFDSVNLWANQASWKIDPANGVDTAVGTPAAPIKTWAEFTRRVKTIACAMTLLIAGNMTEELIGFFVADNGTASLDINGVPTVLATATGTTFTDPVRSGAQAMGTMTSGSVATFAAYAGKLLRVVGSKTCAPIIGTSGAAPQLPYWFNEDTFSNNKPVDGTSVEVLDLPTVPTFQIAVVGMPLAIRWLKTTNNAFAKGAWVRSDNLDGVSVVGVEFGGHVVCFTDTYYMGCQLSGSGNVYPYAPARFLGGGSRARDLFILAGGSQVNVQGFIVNGAGTVVTGVTLGNGANAGALVSLVAFSASLGLGIFNCTGDGLSVGVGGYASLQSLFGNGNGGYGMQCFGGGRVWCTNTPTITGTSGDLRFCAAANAIPPLTGGASVPAAVACGTWAQWAAAPFNKLVMNYGNGSCIAGVV